MDDMWKYRDTTWSEGDDVVGYDVEAVDGDVGKVDEATAETDRSHIVVDTGFWILEKKRLIPAGLVTEVDHDGRRIRVSLSKDQIKAAPDYEGDLDDDARERHSRHYSGHTG